MSAKSPLIRILLVDDDPGVNTLLSKVMDVPPPAAVEIVFVQRAEDAEAAVKEWRPSVVLLDLNLSPEWPWDRTMAFIPTMERIADAPVIAFSGLAPDELWVKAVRDYGAYNYFHKADYMRPEFRGQLLRDITNATYQYKFRRNAAPSDVAP